jgi:cell division protein FtsB
MDFRVKSMARIRRFPSPQASLRAVAERAPQAEALAATWISWIRMGWMQPAFSRVYGLRRRLATIAVAVLAALLFVHVLLGANGMVVYKQKRAEFESLQKKIALEQKENELYRQQIQGLKNDAKAIEKEAREQLRYARPGEYVYVPQTPANLPPPATHSARK